MGIERHREKFSLCDGQLLLELDMTIFYTERKL